jgi:hypothetical protein
MAISYNVNFPSNLIFNGKTTRFLRIKFPEIVPDNTTVPKNGNFYVTIKPVSSSNTDNFLLNDVNINDLLNTTDYLDTSNRPSSEYWQPVASGKEYAYRIDYDGNVNAIIGLIIYVSDSDPGDITINNPTIESININVVGYEIPDYDSREIISSLPLQDTKLHDATASALLIRTNPMLSGNVKLTIDSSNDLWLNSIDANDHLSNARFKKFKVSPNSSYAADLYNFLDKGQVPADVLFDIKEYDNLYESIKKEYLYCLMMHKMQY